MKMFLTIVATFVFVGMAITIDGKASECPQFVPTTKDISKFSGVWYRVQSLNVNLDVKADEDRCVRCQVHINNQGKITGTCNQGNQDDSTVNVSVIPIDHQRTRLSFVSSDDGNDAFIHNYLDFYADDYFIAAFCRTINDIEGYTIYVYARDKRLPASTVNKIKKFLRDSHLADNLRTVNQSC